MTLTQERLRDVLYYNPDTGLFYWINPSGRRAKVGDIAGSRMGLGYVLIRIDRENFLAHRLAWFWVHGEWPSEDLDHINTVVDDNRIANLRPATRSENMRNRGPVRSNRSGLKGVYWNNAAHGWVARIMLMYRGYHLGVFDCPAAAHFAYIIEADKLHGEFARANGVA